MQALSTPELLPQIGVPRVPGWGDGGWGGGGGVCGMHDRPLKKTANFFQVEAGHIFVLGYTEGE